MQLDHTRVALASYHVVDAVKARPYVGPFGRRPLPMADALDNKHEDGAADEVGDLGEEGVALNSEEQP